MRRCNVRIALRRLRDSHSHRSLLYLPYNSSFATRFARRTPNPIPLTSSLNDFDSSLKSVGSGLVCLQTKDWTTDARISAAVTAAATSSDSDSESESDGDSLLLPPFTPSDYAYALTLHSFLSTLPSTSQVTIVYERETSLPSLRRWRCCLELAVDGKDNVNATTVCREAK